MGEIIQVYGSINMKGKIYDVELNGPIREDIGGIVHIQSADSRIEMSQLEFYRMVGTLNLAKTNLRKVKGLKKNE